jgi:hypothetical protein
MPLIKTTIAPTHTNLLPPDLFRDDGSWVERLDAVLDFPNLSSCAILRSRFCKRFMLPVAVREDSYALIH